MTTPRRTKREDARRAQARRRRQGPVDRLPFFSRLSTDWVVWGLIGGVVLIAGLVFFFRQVVSTSRVDTPDFEQVFSLAVSPTNPQTAFLGTVTGLFRSIDGGESWESFAIEEPVRTLYNDPNDPNVFYAAGPMTVHKSVDGGETWAPVALDLPAGTVGSLVADPADSSNMYAFISGENGLYGTTDGGATWTQRNPVPRAALTSLAVKPGDPATVYAFHNVDGFVISRDSGTRFDPIGEGIPKNAVTNILTIPGEPDTVLAAAGGTVSGMIYRSTDSGRTWTVLDSGLENVRIIAITRSHGTGHLYASDARGVTYISTNGGERWQRNEPP